MRNRIREKTKEKVLFLVLFGLTTAAGMYVTTYLTNYNATKNIDCIAKINNLDIPKHQGGRYSLSGFIGLDMTSDSLLVNMHSNNGDLINRYVRFTPKYDWLGRIQTLAIDTLFKSPQEAGTLLNDYAEFIDPD
jgi:hypothetical protein